MPAPGTGRPTAGDPVPNNPDRTIVRVGPWREAGEGTHAHTVIVARDTTGEAFHEYAVWTLVDRKKEPWTCAKYGRFTVGSGDYTDSDEEAMRLYRDRASLLIG